MTPETLTRLIARMQHKADCKRPKACPAIKTTSGWCFYCVEPIDHSGPHQHPRVGTWEEDVVVCTCDLDADLALLRGLVAQVAQLEARVAEQAHRIMFLSKLEKDNLARAEDAEASLASVTAEWADYARLIVQANERTSQAEALAMHLQDQLAALSYGICVIQGAIQQQNARGNAGHRQLARWADQLAALSQGHDQ